MANLSVKLWQVLQQLKEDEFKKFKWLIKQDNVSEGRSGISAAQLEKADPQDTVDLMAQKYGSSGAIKETMKALEKISRNDLAQSLQKSCLEPKDLGPQDDEVKKAEQKSNQQFEVDVTVAPDLSRPRLVSSVDGKYGKCSRSWTAPHGDVRTKLLENPERFFRCVCWSSPSIDQQGGTNQSPENDGPHV